MGVIMSKRIIIVSLAILLICVAVTIFVVNGNKGNVSTTKRVVGHSKLYDENLINDACDAVEKEFVKEFKGCTLIELRYDAEVENQFADEIARYKTEENQEIIILLSTFKTDEKGGDGSFNPNEIYTDWQWNLVRISGEKSWEIISWGY